MIIMIAVKEVPVPQGQAPRRERVVVGPYDSESEFRPDMAAAEQAGYQTSAFVVEDPRVFRSTLGLPL